MTRRPGRYPAPATPSPWPLVVGVGLAALIVGFGLGRLTAPDPEGLHPPDSPSVVDDGAAAPDPDSAETPRDDPYPGRVGPFPVSYVVDGDTLAIDYHGRDDRVRLLRIDTPERDESGYLEASQALEALVAGKEVHLLFEEAGTEARDRPNRPGRQGRLLAYVLLGDRLVNLEMVRQGWSRFWTKYGEGRFAGRFRQAEAEARAAGAGLWTAAGWNR